MFLYIQIKKKNQKGGLNLIVFIIKILKIALIARKKKGWGMSPLPSVTMRIVPALVLTPNYLHSSFSFPFSFIFLHL